MKDRYWETVMGAQTSALPPDALSSVSSESSTRRADTPSPTVLMPLWGHAAEPRRAAAAAAASAGGGVHKSRAGQRQFACTRCDARFERRGHLQSHIDTVHDRKRPFACPRRCGKVFGHRSSLSRHIRTAHDRDSAPAPYPAQLLNALSQR